MPKVTQLVGDGVRIPAHTSVIPVWSPPHPKLPTESLSDLPGTALPAPEHPQGRSKDNTGRRGWGEWAECARGASQEVI